MVANASKDLRRKRHPPHFRRSAVRHGRDRPKLGFQTFCCPPPLPRFGKKAQVCGIMAGPRLEEVKNNAIRLPSRLNSTWGGNFTDMVRSTHYLRSIDRENFWPTAAKVG